MDRVRQNSSAVHGIADKRLVGMASKRRLLAALGLPLSCCLCQGQSAQPGPIGNVSVKFADVSRPLSVAGDVATLGGDTTVTALARTAQVNLTRSGSILVCATTSLRLSQNSTSASTPHPLLLALDRGAIEVQMPAATNDAIMTPDLRFQVVGASASSALDLRLRVARNGDTCVENAGTAAPTLAIAEQLGEATYQLQPGQHVMFEQGSLKEVVDHESSPCGCPPAAPTSIADAGVTSSKPAAPGDAVAAKDTTHPFPIAVSEGLAPPPDPATSKPGEVQTQITMPLVYSGNGNGNASAGGGGTSSASPAGATGSSEVVSSRSGASPSVADKPSPAATAQSTSQPAAQAPPPPESTGPHPLRAIGHFFKRIFRRG